MGHGVEWLSTGRGPRQLKKKVSVWLSCPGAIPLACAMLALSAYIKGPKDFHSGIPTVAATILQKPLCADAEQGPCSSWHTSCYSSLVAVRPFYRRGNWGPESVSDLPGVE